jgi:hypothetical protein
MRKLYGVTELLGKYDVESEIKIATFLLHECHELFKNYIWMHMGSLSVCDCGQLTTTARALKSTHKCATCVIGFEF